MRKMPSRQDNLPIIKMSLVMGLILMAGFVFFAAQIFGL